MERKTLSVGKKITLKIKAVPGDLRLSGWQEDEIKAKTSGSLLELNAEGELATLRCDNDLILSVPENAQIEIEAISGDASCRVLNGGLKLAQVGGDLALRNVGDVALEVLGGDFVVRHSSGALKAAQIGGDASVRDVVGDIQLSSIGGDLHLRDPQGNVNVMVGGDAVAFVSPQAEAAYQLQAGGDVLLRLPVDADAELNLTAAGDLDVHLPDVDETDESPRALTLGSGSAKMDINAGGDLLVTSRSDDWADMADFDISLPFIGADFPGLPDDFAERIARKAEDAARKVEVKMRKSEHKLRAAERHARRAAMRVERHVHFSKPPKPPRRPKSAVSSESVSEEERMLILKMLEEKKITAADAEKLLAALE